MQLIELCRCHEPEISPEREMFAVALSLIQVVTANKLIDNNSFSLDSNHGWKFSSLFSKFQWVYCYFHSVATAMTVSYSSQRFVENNKNKTTPQWLERAILEKFLTRL